MYHGRTVPGFPRHPHRGFETVTVVRRGLLDHADSLGAAARYGDGDVQWLTAGSGIQHAEMFPLLDPAAPNPLELFQIWLNLPRSHKMVDPHFSMLWRDQVPRVAVLDGEGRAIELTLIAGRLPELPAPAKPPPSSWAAQPGSELVIWTIRLAAGARWTLPAAGRGTKRALYHFRGSPLELGGRTIAAQQLIDLSPERPVALAGGPSGSELLLLGGAPIGEPVVQHGPFVMNTREEIQRAYADFQRTQFGGWPWPSADPVHGVERARFARRVDGAIERPG
jgi:hypothetical protein